MKQFYAPDITPMPPNGCEVTCRYCGQRFFVMKGEKCIIVVGKKSKIIGYAHETCSKNMKKEDKHFRPGTLRSPELENDDGKS